MEMLIEMFLFIVVYVCFLMLFNVVLFVVIVICYIKMYCLILGFNVWNLKDFCIVKWMVIFVFIDFFCWVFIIFFFIIVVFGKNLVGLNEVKVLIIFVLFLNSCVNLFLYVIFMK